MPVARALLKNTKAPSNLPQTITAWSYSRYRDWKRCPFYAKCKHVLRMPEPGSPAMDRGGDIHKMAQEFTEAKRPPKVIPDELATFEQEFKIVRKMRPVCESEWAFNAQWAVTGWFDKDAWCRVKMDLHYMIENKNRLVVVDHKTGKVDDGEKYRDQEELYALSGMLQYPDVSEVEVQFWYLDAGVKMPEDERVYPIKQMPNLRKEWEKRVKPMLADKMFVAKPNWACGRCPYSKSKGGPCKF
jgi:hypothetical protein